ncbi:ABC transporter substrate-binding protein [Micropruina sp.]|uniref:ABC transporter substrate-binding protein n=1 Tax=Micropruina sp. TaxID=2737536 RepID=UPI0039E50044
MAGSKPMVMIAATVAAVGLALSGCSSAPAGGSSAATKTLKISTFSFGVEGFTEAVVKPFEAKTGIQVEVVTGKNAERLNELKATENSAGIDVMVITDNFAAQGQADKLFEQVDATKLTSLADVADFAKGADLYGPATTYQLNGIVYDTRKVSAKEAKSWDLFGESKVAGKVALPDISATSGQLTVSGLGTTYGSGPFDYDTALGKLAKWKPNVLKFYASTTEVSNLMTQGEIVAAASISGFAADLISKDANFAFAVPEKGAYLATNRAMIPAGATNVDGAYQFIDYLLSADAQAAALKGYNDLPVNTKVDVPDSMATMLGGAVPDPTKAGYETIDAIKAAAEFSTLADRFAREVTGS